MRASDRLRTTALVVGGGPIGLATALLLERFGIAYVVLERSASTTDHPKARGCDIRTMELFRQWGIENKIIARGLPPGADVFAFVETINGHEYGRTVPEPNLGHSPSWRCIVSQDVVEEELYAALRHARHGEVRYRTEYLEFRDADQRLLVSARDLASGAALEWECEFLIGADGAGSTVRRQADIQMRGPPTLAVMANEYWTADLSAIPRIAITSAYRIAPRRPGESVWTVLNTNGKNRWLSAGRVGAERDERPEPRTDAEVVQLARLQTGISELDVRVISRSIWRLSRQVAAQFKRKRVFLVGDAAHRFPPNGGFGMNTGIHDAHNLAWKLKYVLNGWAGPNLLETYDSERRPVAESNADFSLGNHTRFIQTELALHARNPEQIAFWIRDSNNHLHSSGQSLGFSYQEGAVAADGTVAPSLNSRTYLPSDRPGARFPHLWLDLARTQSTLDWFDRALVLVAGPKGDFWSMAAAEVSAKLGVPVEFRMLEAADPRDGLQLGQRGAVLVRPDGHVGWRMPWVPSDPTVALGNAVSTILSR